MAYRVVFGCILVTVTLTLIGFVLDAAALTWVGFIATLLLAIVLVLL